MTVLARALRDHGDAIEADLAFRQIDLRDFYRAGSGFTLRRLLVLVRALPADSAFWAAVAQAAEQAKVPTAEQIRARQEYYRSQGN